MAATLLLADDSITIQRVIELTFADEDMRVLVASDGQQAIQKIEAERPDIVLADIGMPRVDGYAVAAHVKQSPSLKHIPVLLLTGAFEPIDEARARQTGCDGVLVKPFEPQKLVARVKELLAGARGAEMWPVDMPRTPAPLPELLRAEQFEVAAPPLSMPAASASETFEPDPVLEPLGGSFFDRGDVETVAAEASANDEPRAALEGEDVANRHGDHGYRQTRPELPPPVDRLETELDMLDAALSRLDPTAHPHELDAETASDFARDLNELRNEARLEDTQVTRPSRPAFGSWDLPQPSNGEPHVDHPIDIIAEEVPLATQAVPPRVEIAPVVIPAPAPVAPAPVFVEPAPVHAPAHVAPAAPAAPVAPAARAAERPTLAVALSALLAAENSRPVAHAAAPQISEAAIEEVVKRVLARMAGDTVNRVVLETAERMIREEISRTKDPSPR